MVNQTIERFKNQNLPSKKIQINTQKTPKFYITPKIHTPDNPGRPVINLTECNTPEISRFVVLFIVNFEVSLAEFEQKYIYPLIKHKPTLFLR